MRAVPRHLFESVGLVPVRVFSHLAPVAQQPSEVPSAAVLGSYLAGHSRLQWSARARTSQSIARRIAPLCGSTHLSALSVLCLSWHVARAAVVQRWGMRGVGYEDRSRSAAMPSSSLCAAADGPSDVHD